VVIIEHCKPAISHQRYDRGAESVKVTSLAFQQVTVAPYFNH